MKHYKKYFNSVCHKEVVETIGLPVKTADAEHRAQERKTSNRAMLHKIIESIATLLARDWL